MRPLRLISLLCLGWAGLVTAAAATTEQLKTVAPQGLSGAHLMDTALGLVLVLALMLGLAWLVKRYGQIPGIHKGQVQVLGGVSLGAREKAVLLSVQGRILLVGVAPGRVQTLLVLDGPVAADQAFAETLADARQGVERGDAGGAG